MNHPKIFSSKQDYKIDLVSQRGEEIQISIHPPSRYIFNNCERILPDWKNKLEMSVIIVLQQSRFALTESSPEIETEKQRLRARFMRFACDVAFELRDQNYLTDLIDPRTGYPLLSHPGQIPHDDTAVVKALLKYPIICNQCRVLIHPKWGAAVYPSILISAAPQIIIIPTIQSIATLHGWEQLKVKG
ncbi:MAG: methylmalonic aciduria and homocystinuria type D protein [Richelia sp. RM2_1_2]|nr:methylmalonic aciduria and homocystinuria type D protein [Richelia sp. SM1_7_0]NJN09081.1 methylmalonic aciduria and homocystinuria type D protein [Richelia sp. RM1_1_1]NJO28773.1 methylmalonic aciduria and homocystinuria type D protein [Richelia sp. SL_2_1]NJO62433.1 methylmalonic aciduria and homocystinuria type D protein [Richelia sp. RM2_1_2]